jgi:ubiquinone biosynthesis protein Coq4
MNTMTFYQKFKKRRERILSKIVALLNPVYQGLMPRNRAWKLTKNQLKTFPDGTLAKDLAAFLDQNKFDLLPYLETHDIYHVLLQYEPNIVDEARMYFFMLGNGKYSFEVINTVIVSWILLPDYWSDLIQHYNRGHNARSIAKWDFRYLLHEDTTYLRDIIFNQTEPKFYV